MFDLCKYLFYYCFQGEDGASVPTIEKFLKENFSEKIEAITDLNTAIKHAIQRGINSGRFTKEGRYVKLSERTAREALKPPAAQKEILKEKVNFLKNRFLLFIYYIIYYITIHYITLHYITSHYSIPVLYYTIMLCYV